MESAPCPKPLADAATVGVVQLRTFEVADYAAARALWQCTPGVGLSAADEPAAIARFLARNPGLSQVALRDGQLVATLLCGHDGRRGLIHHLVVAPALRRQGLARRLVDTALAALATQGIDKCHLMVFRDNRPGQAFWAATAVERPELALYSASTRGAG
jgi:ribosomal protein S18 acetylase RimI-like enzyme